MGLLAYTSLLSCGRTLTSGRECLTDTTKIDLVTLMLENYTQVRMKMSCRGMILISNLENFLGISLINFEGISLIISLIYFEGISLINF